MIKVNKVRNDLGMNDIIISKDNQGMMMLYDEKNTLHWVIKDSQKPLEITKENYILYNLFEQLFAHIMNSEVFQLTSKDINSCSTIEELLALKQQIKKSKRKREGNGLIPSKFYLLTK